MSEAKRQKTETKYELLYHGGIPGRGEFVRLAFEAAGVSYTDPGNAGDQEKKKVYEVCGGDITSDPTNRENPPAFSPPSLRIEGASKNGKSLLLHQTPNILLYLGPKLGLVGSDEEDLYFVNQLTLTALDINNEAHDTHHPLAVMKYYEGKTTIHPWLRDGADHTKTKRTPLSKKRPTSAKTASQSSSPTSSAY